MSKIIDITKGVTISVKAKEAISFWDRLLGLINPHNSRFLILRTRFGIHTFFLGKSIDVIVMNDSKRIVKMKTNLQPYQFFFYNLSHSLVIEMPKETISHFSLELNDIISIE